MNHNPIVNNNCCYLLSFQDLAKNKELKKMYAPLHPVEIRPASFGLPAYEGMHYYMTQVECLNNKYDPFGLEDATPEGEEPMSEILAFLGKVNNPSSCPTQKEIDDDSDEFICLPRTLFSPYLGEQASPSYIELSVRSLLERDRQRRYKK